MGVEEGLWAVGDGWGEEAGAPYTGVGGRWRLGGAGDEDVVPKWSSATV